MKCRLQDEDERNDKKARELEGSQVIQLYIYTLIYVHILFEGERIIFMYIYLHSVYEYIVFLYIYVIHVCSFTIWMIGL
jgi:hypothetical protein